MGLVARDGYWGGGDRRGVYLNDAPSSAFGVAVEAASADAAIDAPLRMREEDGRLIVEGTQEQIAAAARLLEQIKAK